MPSLPTAISPFHKTALITTGATAAGGLLHAPLAWIPAVLFILLCAVASLHPRSSFYLPVISRVSGRNRTVALTFDDGPDPATTPRLLALLAENGIPATFFVTGKRARAHPELIRSIAEAGHTLGNHSYAHSTLIAFKGRQRIFEDINATQAALARHGIACRLFRPPVGITYPGLKPVLAALNLTAVGFSCRALDFGNRDVRHISRRILAAAAPGDIIMLHDLPPHPPDRMEAWITEINTVLRGLKAKNLAVRPLEKLIDLPIDNRNAKAER